MRLIELPLDECGLISRVPDEAWKNKAKTLITFSGLQTLVQGVLALSGFLIVRILNKPEYAAYTIAASLQTLLNALTDCGIGWGLTAPEIDRRVRAGGRESESLVGRELDPGKGSKLYGDSSKKVAYEIRAPAAFRWERL